MTNNKIVLLGRDGQNDRNVKVFRRDKEHGLLRIDDRYEDLYLGDRTPADDICQTCDLDKLCFCRCPRRRVFL